MALRSFEERTTLTGTLTVELDIFHREPHDAKPGGSVPAQHLSDSTVTVFLQLSPKQVQDLGELTVGQLKIWCRAVTGQSGQLVLRRGFDPTATAGSSSHAVAAGRLAYTT